MSAGGGGSFFTRRQGIQLVSWRDYLRWAELMMITWWQSTQTCQESLDCCQSSLLEYMTTSPNPVCCLSAAIRRRQYSHISWSLRNRPCVMVHKLAVLPQPRNWALSYISLRRSGRFISAVFDVAIRHRWVLFSRHLQVGSVPSGRPLHHTASWLSRFCVWAMHRHTVPIETFCCVRM